MKLDLHSLLEGLTDTQQRQLRTYEELLENLAVPAGLISDRDRGRTWSRHVLDSLRALPCLLPQPHRIADLGSGAGLPGIPVAVARPDCAAFLIESRARRAAFLERSIQELGLRNTTVLVTRAEGAAMAVDVCLARALGPPDRSWQLAEGLLPPEGFLVYFGGRSFHSHRRGLAERGISLRICVPGAFPWQGPVVIMRRVSPD